ncbi:MAG: 4Fe-4S dicluster domain-containing protein, partial [Lachnospiraceae bacterium]|nr:4Fe-4S dicluster domain-containing protein [Lachnospiraceae bacterium]
RWPCALKKFSQADQEEFTDLFVTRNKVLEDTCVGCKLCMKAGCPAMSFDTKAKKARIHPAQCVGCDVCMQICKHDAIVKE